MNTNINIDRLYVGAVLSSVVITPNNLPNMFRLVPVYGLMSDILSAVNTPMDTAGSALSPAGESALAPCRTSSSPGISEEAYEVTTDAMRLVRAESRGGVLTSLVNPDRTVRLDDYPTLYYRIGENGSIHVHTQDSSACNVYMSDARVSFLAQRTGCRDISEINAIPARRLAPRHRISIRCIEYDSFVHYQVQAPAPARGGRILVVLLENMGSTADSVPELLETLLVMRIPADVQVKQLTRLASHLVFDEETFAYLDAKYGTRAVAWLNDYRSSWDRKVNVYYNRQPVLAARTQLSAKICVC